ncbi:cupin domain-containing protein [Micromonospora cathayae]|uniref:Cupin domain-containing protein n=1 Tax=Micromonospora cathayae TaxID=3028804 RepID=A0ABY7ZHT4_9ACTN|nr:cupin domain-containing protein [Micromonospora sp. HUAS 3]WDZ82440.1 cupin domain-containing protein [Micromonospora sp. HUAS 3]
MDKVQLRRLPVTEPPIPPGGGRIQSDAGELAQIASGPDAYRFVAYLELRPGRPRGNHYHTRKTETLYVVSGRVRAVFHDLTSGRRSEAVLEPGHLVTIQPHCAHVFHALDPAQAVELADVPYDPADTHPHQVGERA